MSSPVPAFRAVDPTGRVWTEADLAGKLYVLTFYPKDETPGCVRQVCAFRDAWSDFEALGIAVFGVSRDPPASHAEFIAHRKLPYTLLSDESGAMHKAFDIGKFFGVTRRKSFLVDEAGRVVHVHTSDLRAESHADAMLEAAKRHLAAKP